MRIDDCWDNHRSYSSTLSNVLRQSALASIALIWILNNERAQAMDPALLASGLFLILGLVADAVQYICGTISWHVFCAFSEWKFKKGQTGTDEEINERMGRAYFSPWNHINIGTNLFFYLKIPLYCTGYFKLIAFLGDKLVP